MLRNDALIGPKIGLCAHFSVRVRDESEFSKPANSISKSEWRALAV
jgi:hypothetical protein